MSKKQTSVALKIGREALKMGGDNLLDAIRAQDGLRAEIAIAWIETKLKHLALAPVSDGVGWKAHEIVMLACNALDEADSQ